MLIVVYGNEYVIGIYPVHFCFKQTLLLCPTQHHTCRLKHGYWMPQWRQVATTVCLLCHFIFSEHLWGRVELFSLMGQNLVNKYIRLGMAWYISTQSDGRSVLLAYWVKYCVKTADWCEQMEFLKWGQSCIFATPPCMHPLAVSLCISTSVVYRQNAGRFSISITFTHTVTPYYWNSLRVTCLAQGTVGRCSGKYCYMHEPTHLSL